MGEYDGRDEGGKDPQEELRELLRELMSGGGSFDPAKLAGVGGLPDDPALVRDLVARMQEAISRPGTGLDVETAKQHARSVAQAGNREIPAAESDRYEQVFRIAELWLGEATQVGELVATPRTMTRLEWINGTMPLWTQLAEPVAESIANALMDVLADQVPPELASVVGQSGAMMRNIGGAMFAVQLGQIIGQLSGEVVSGGDIGIPVLDTARAVLLPQNVDAFGEGLDIASDEVELYLAVREIAHARLFQHAKWLRLHLVSSITEFARGIHVDVSAMQELAEELDPSSPDAIREALSSGKFIPPRTPEQEAALQRLETVLALVEGWVDVVTQEATGRLPRAEALAEVVRRRRATGGPAERAFGSLVGLELRPRRLREAAAMWRAVEEAHGAEVRDSLWDHFDALPGAADIDDPAFLVTRLGAGATAPDDFDAALESLLGDPSAFGTPPLGIDEQPRDGDDDSAAGKGPAAA